MMNITRQKVAQKLIDYLHHRISLTELVNWAESTMMEADFDEQHFEVLREIVGRVGLADVKAFGISWEEKGDVKHEMMNHFTPDLQMILSMKMRPESFKDKIEKLKEAMRDTLFLNDLREISEDFKAVDLEGWILVVKTESLQSREMSLWSKMNCE
jgi:hypothetical protein